MKMRLTLAAFDDLQDIHWYCSLFNEDYARQTEKELFDQFEVFEQFPQLGASTDEEDVRRWPMRKHLTIFYRIDQQDALSRFCAFFTANASAMSIACRARDHPLRYALRSRVPPAPTRDRAFASRPTALPFRFDRASLRESPSNRIPSRLGSGQRVRWMTRTS
jgi:plasmid stabilization system protein ParE